MERAAALRLEYKSCTVRDRADHLAKILQLCAGSIAQRDRSDCRFGFRLGPNGSATLDERQGLSDMDLIVVELNRVILERDTYAATPVSEGDQIELVHFVGGG